MGRGEEGGEGGSVRDMRRGEEGGEGGSVRDVGRGEEGGEGGGGVQFVVCEHWVMISYLLSASLLVPAH